ncbi:MAG: hypothetical protein GY867_10040 [bacterium]|nr:hypothetical protein [bacterium]
MIFGLLTKWRVYFFIGLLVLVAAGGFLPQTGKLLLACWWFEEQNRKPVSWRMIQRTIPVPSWWVHARRGYRWARFALGLGLCLWLVGHLTTQPASLWAWFHWLAVWYVVVREIHSVLSAWIDIELAIPQPVEGQESGVEVTIDLEPLLAELGDLSPTPVESSTISREALTARIESIRAECFHHPVSHELMKQLESEIQAVIRRVLNEALNKELDEHLGFGRYERTGEAKPPSRHRSGFFPRSLRTVWGPTGVRVPKLRQGNKKRDWQVLERYERSFGPWLDLQLHMYRLGCSQRDLQEVLHLGFRQVLSVKSVEHLTDVAREEMEAFRQAPLEETPPVIIVDGVNIKMMCPTGTYHVNRRGQRRMIKRRMESVILAALGVWPDGRYRILYFEVFDKETKANWKQFFRHLQVKGLDMDKLQLVVSDGRPGLHTAIRDVFPETVKHQRCVFHKLKNLADNLDYKQLQLAPDLPRREAVRQAKKARARAILQDAAAIYAGSDLAAIAQRLAEFQQKWRDLEPKAVRCFSNDFDLTLNYLRVPFPCKRLIRTTNLLERFFREFGSRADEIGCFGSQAQAETLFYLILEREKAKHAVI